MTYERRHVWFWQSRRFQLEGWTLQWSYANNLFGYLIEYPVGWLRPLAVR